MLGKINNNEVAPSESSLRVTLSGAVGSGKSTIGKQLSQLKGVEFLSVGNISRQKATSMGMDIDEFQIYLKRHPEMDVEMDRYIQKVIKSKNSFVLDYRLGFYFIPDSFHVFLNVSDQVALKRVGDRNTKDENYKILSAGQAIAKLNARNIRMQSRFNELYNVDFLNPLNYDLIIDTDNLNPEEITKAILLNYKNRIHKY